MISGGVVLRRSTGLLLIPLVLGLGEAGNHAAAEGKVLRFANRPEFIADDTVQKFQAETGIAVTYDVYPSDEIMFDTLNGHNKSKWDLVVVSTVPVLARAVPLNLLQPVETDTLLNYGNLDHDILGEVAAWDPGNKIAVPFLWGTAGLGINPARLTATVPDAPLDSLAIVFDPALAARLAPCGVAMEDAPEDAIPAALSFLGIDPLTTDPKDLDRAGDLLERLKPFVRRLSPADLVEALASGTVCAAFGASVDVTDARTQADDRNNDVELTYVIPKERTRMWIDVLAIPAGAEHPDEARAFINFLLRPEIISDITDWTGAVNPNTLAADFVDDDKTDQTIFPSADSRRRLFLDRPLSPEAAAQRARIWARTKP